MFCLTQLKEDAHDQQLEHTCSICCSLQHTGLATPYLSIDIQFVCARYACVAGRAVLWSVRHIQRLGTAHDERSACLIVRLTLQVIICPAGYGPISSSET